MVKLFVVLVAVIAVVANAFTHFKLSRMRSVSVQMNGVDRNVEKANWGRAFAILSLTAGLYSAPAFAAESVATQPASVLKSVLNDYKEKSTIDPAATIVPAIVPPKKVTPPAAVKATPPPVKKVFTPPPVTPQPAAVYSIKPDTELLKKLEATKKSNMSAGKEKEAVKPVPAVAKPVAVAPAAPKAVEKVVKAVEKPPSAPVQKPKVAPAVATPVTTTSAKKPELVRPPSIPEERAVVEAYNKKAATKSKIDQLSVNVKVSKSKLTQSRSDMKKSESKIAAFDKKLSNGKMDKDLRNSIAEDKKEEEKIFNQARKVLKDAENDIEKGTTDISKLETTLKGDDKLIDSKKALLKKREEEIVKETKAAADKKLKQAADARAALLAKDVKAAEGVVAKAQADLQASINMKKQSQLQVAASKDLVKAEKEALKKATDNVKSIMKSLEKGKALEESENKKIVELTGKVAVAELAEAKAGDVIKSMEGLVNEAKAKLSITAKGGK